MEQRSNEWFRARLGKLTASEISCLMKDHRELMTREELAAYKAANPQSRTTTKTAPFSDATYTYLNRKIMENFMPLNSTSAEIQDIIKEYIEEHSFSNRATQWGSYWEDKAREEYAKTMGYEVVQIGFEPYKKYPNLFGASPDGLIRQERGGVEIKCPYTMEKHMQHLTYTTPKDLKENEENYYWQMYACMLVTDCEWWDFVSYNPYVSKKLQLKVLRIYRDEKEINLLKNRIDLAIEYIKQQINFLSTTDCIIISV